MQVICNPRKKNNTKWSLFVRMVAFEKEPVVLISLNKYMPLENRRRKNCNCQKCNKMPTGLECMFCHGIPEVKAFHFKGKARLLEYSCSGIYRSSHLQMIFKICVLENFAIFTGKHLCWSHFFWKIFFGANFLTFSKRDPSTGVFLWIIQNSEEQPFLEHPWWLLLNFLQSLLKITVKKIIFQ